MRVFLGILEAFMAKRTWIKLNPYCNKGMREVNGSCYLKIFSPFYHKKYPRFREITPYSLYIGPVYMKKVGPAKRDGPLNQADFHLAFRWQMGWFSAWLLIPLCKQVSKIIMKIEKSTPVNWAEEFTWRIPSLLQSGFPPNRAGLSPYKRYFLLKKNTLYCYEGPRPCESARSTGVAHLI